MKTWVKRGAIVLLGLIALPFLLAMSKNPIFVTPLWAGIFYLGFNKTFPTRRAALALPLAVHAGIAAC